MADLRIVGLGGSLREASRSRAALALALDGAAAAGATVELLETLGVPVLGWQTDDLPLFYTAHGGPKVSARVDGEDEAARVAAAHWEFGGGGILVGRPPDESLDDIEPLIERALAEAEREGVHGQAVTPFVLGWLHRESGGETQRVNRDLIVGNAQLAGRIAAAATRAS